MNWEALERRFRQIGVPLRAADRPWFSVDVGRERGERIVLAPGDASVVVMDADPAQQQLLLLVQEVDSYRGRRMTQKVLCGRDERSLFAVTVPNPFGVAVNTVAAAHEALKPEAVRAEGRGVLRQGDWFFVPYPHVSLDLWGVRKRVRLGFRNPHIVDSLVGDERFGLGAVGRAVLARGFVRHREHRPLNLRVWHRVFPNTAFRASGSYAD